MSIVEAVIARIERYCSEHKIAETTFGRLAVNDGKLIDRLRHGKSITLDTLQKIEAALATPPDQSRERAKAS